MMEFIQMMAKPLLACLILTGIHAYLGIHVIERQVIFVDLALAQIAALGAAVALIFHFSPESPASYFFSHPNAQRKNSSGSHYRDCVCGFRGVSDSCAEPLRGRG